MRAKIYFIGFLVCVGLAVWLFDHQPSPVRSPVDKRTDSILDDTLLFGPSDIKPDTHSGVDSVLEKFKPYLKKMDRCVRLQDSQLREFILYRDGKRTFEAYQRAYQLYTKYYITVYKPAFDSLKK